MAADPGEAGGPPGEARDPPADARTRTRDPPGDGRSTTREAPDTGDVPESFLTTIRVQRADGGFAATQHGVVATGRGATPHRAIVDLVRQLERDCFG